MADLYGRAPGRARTCRPRRGAPRRPMIWRRARSDLRLEIARAYWALVTAGESQRVVDESLNRVGAHLRDVRNQLNAGLVPPNDVLSVEAQESRQRMLTIQARTTRDNAEAELARLIGEPGAAIEPSAALDPPRAAARRHSRRWWTRRAVGAPNAPRCSSASARPRAGRLRRPPV